jgi:DNA-binding NarL/FixJ family response regulator
MRVVIVGRPADRARVRDGLNGALDVVAEFETLAESRAAGHQADATIIAEAARPADRFLARGGSWPEISRGEEALHEPLTAREIQVLELLAEGLPNKRIAERLGISDQTVKFHVASISGKLGAVNRTDAVRRAVRRGLITL